MSWRKRGKFWSWHNEPLVIIGSVIAAVLLLYISAWVSAHP